MTERAIGTHRVMITYDDDIKEFKVEHPVDCDRLPYGQECDFDRLSGDGVEQVRYGYDFPQQAGTYTATVVHGVGAATVIDGVEYPHPGRIEFTQETGE